jgi:hypothetical protein
VARRSGKSISEDLLARRLCLPSGTAMGEGEVERVGKIVRREGKALDQKLKSITNQTLKS